MMDRERYKEIIKGLVGARRLRGLFLGCTELPLLIKKEDCHVVLFDTMKIHAQAILDYAEEE